MKKYLVEIFFEFVDIACELECLKLHFLQTLHDKEVEDLFGDEVSEVSDDQSMVRVDSFSQLKN